MSATVFYIANTIKLVLFNRELVQRGTSLSNLVYIALLSAAWGSFLWLSLLSRKRRAWLAAFYLVQLAYLVLNIGYFRYYNAYLSFRQAFRILGEFGGLATGGGVPMDVERRSFFDFDWAEAWEKVLTEIMNCN